MAHFSYIAGRGSLANWATLTTVAPSEFWWFESNLFKAINGDEGGTWNPSAKIALGGAYGLELSSSTPLNALGECLLGSTGKQLYFNGLADFNAAATFYGSVAVAGATGTFSCVKATTFGNTVTFEDFAQFDGNVVLGYVGTDTVIVKGALTAWALVTAIAGLTVTSGQTLTAAGPTNISGATSLSGAVALTNAVTPGTGGYIKKRRTTITTNSQTVSIENWDVVRVSFASPGEIFLADYGELGVIRIVNNTAGALVVRNTGSYPMKSLAQNTWGDFMRDTSETYDWTFIGGGDAVGVS